MLRTFLFIVRNVFRQHLQYRANVFYTLIHVLFYLFAKVAIWTALYAGKETVAGTTLEEMITYIIVVQLVGIFSSVYVSGQVEERVRSGDVAIDLLKPIDLRLLFVFQNFAGSIYSLTINAVPMLAVALVFFRVDPPASPVHLAYFIASLFGAYLVSAMIEFAKSAVVFWSLRPNTFAWVFTGFAGAFGGGAVPLWFFPPALMALARALPFHLIQFVPAAIYLGKIPVAELPFAILRQAAWVVGLGLLQAALWRRGIRRITVYGG